LWFNGIVDVRKTATQIIIAVIKVCEKNIESDEVGDEGNPPVRVTRSVFSQKRTPRLKDRGRRDCPSGKGGYVRSEEQCKTQSRPAGLGQ
jgi:hypothetical protein